jgi:hypothetical protein
VAGTEPLVLITPGGGEDGELLVTTALRALSRLAPRRVPRAHIVCGPEMAEPRRAAIRGQAARLPGVTVQDFSDDMMSLLAAADVVLAMGGYNTVCELLTLRRRAVLVPRIRPGVEQCIRAERMAAQGLVRMVHPDALTPQVLGAALQAELDAVAAQQEPPKLKRLDGLARVTEAVFELMDLPLAVRPRSPRPMCRPVRAWRSRPCARPRARRPSPRCVGYHAGAARMRPNTAAGRPIGLLVKRFPKLSETFVLEEVLGLERLGVPLQIYTLAPPSDAVTHPDVARVQAGVTPMPPGPRDDPAGFAASHLRCCWPTPCATPGPWWRRCGAVGAGCRTSGAPAG